MDAREKRGDGFPEKPGENVWVYPERFLREFQALKASK